MRFDVHKVRTYLVNELNEATSTVAEVRHDGTDLILVDLYTGESVLIYLIDRLMSINEIKATLMENSASKLHTLFVLWGDMLLPQEDRNYLPEDWMEALFTLYDGKIYGYDAFGPYASVYPVYFHKPKPGLEYFITYGHAIEAANLHCETVHIDSRYMKGFWHVADFSAPEEPQKANGSDSTNEQTRPHLDLRRNSLVACYAVLEIPVDADRAAVRQAYYRLARRYHPDVSNVADSTLRMQQINEAYQRIMEQLADHD
jgi:hypothetical protein